MIAAEALLTEVRAVGAILAVVDGKLRVRVPKGALTPSQRAQLTERKADVIAALVAEVSNDCGQPPADRGVIEPQMSQMSQASQSRTLDPDDVPDDLAAPAVARTEVRSGAADEVWSTLARVATKPGFPDGDDAAAWRAWMHAGARSRHRRDDWPMDEAIALAWGDAINAWHERHAPPPDPDRCAGCGRLLLDHPGMALPDGARVHFDEINGVDCLIVYGERWRSAAHAGLVALGLRPPASGSFERPDGGKAG
jgi:hypothetical protein